MNPKTRAPTIANVARAPIEEAGREAVRQPSALMNGRQADPSTLTRTEPVAREMCGYGSASCESDWLSESYFHPAE